MSKFFHGSDASLLFLTVVMALNTVSLYLSIPHYEGPQMPTRKAGHLLVKQDFYVHRAIYNSDWMPSFLPKTHIAASSNQTQSSVLAAD